MREVTIEKGDGFGLDGIHERSGRGTREEVQSHLELPRTSELQLSAFAEMRER